MKCALALVLLFLVFAGCTQTAPSDATAADAGKDANTVDVNAQTPGENSGTITPETTAGNTLPENTEKFDVFITITDLNGNAVSEASVSLIGNAYDEIADANANGVAEFSAVPAGAYTVLATKTGFPNASQDMNVRAENTAATVVLQGSQLTGTTDANTPVSETAAGTKLAWKKREADGHFSIENNALKVVRNVSKMYLEIDPDVVGELANTTYEWRLKILDGTTTGFPLVLDLYQDNPKRLVKVEHGLENTKLVGDDFEKVTLDLLADYHVFRLVISADETLTLFIDGQQAAFQDKPNSEFVVAEKKRLRFDNYESSVSLDYFWIDVDNDGQWDYTENWDNLDNVK